MKATERRGDPSVLRIDYPGYSGRESLERIDWDDFFDKFECAQSRVLASGPDRQRQAEPVQHAYFTVTAMAAVAIDRSQIARYPLVLMIQDEGQIFQ